MNTPWGNNDHGPGGDPSWLGGKDRGGQQGASGLGRSGASGTAGEPTGSRASSGGWSSDFSSDPASPAGGTRAESHGGGGTSTDPFRHQAPEFGRGAGQAQSRGRDEAESGWAAGFRGEDGSEDGSSGATGKSMAAQLIGLLTSLLGLVIFAVIAYNMGMNLWWVILVVGFPLLSRGIRMLRRNLNR